MFVRITNLEGILRTPMCCECEQEISPTVDSQLGLRIPKLRIRLRTGGPIRMTDSQCTLVLAFVSSDTMRIYIQNLNLCVNVGGKITKRKLSS